MTAQKPLRALVAAVLVLTQALAAAQPLDHDESRRAERDAFLALYHRTAVCMRTAAIAQLRYGNRDKGSILAFMQAACATPVRIHLTTRAGLTSAEADLLITHLAEATLRLQLVPSSFTL